jgi:hypothetical protein
MIKISLKYKLNEYLKMLMGKDLRKNIRGLLNEREKIARIERKRKDLMVKIKQ